MVLGSKLAQRVVNELSEKIGKLPTLAGGIGGLTWPVPARLRVIMGAADAMSALLNLGYGQQKRIPRCCGRGRRWQILVLAMMYHP